MFYESIFFLINAKKHSIGFNHGEYWAENIKITFISRAVLTTFEWQCILALSMNSTILLFLSVSSLLKCLTVSYMKFSNTEESTEPYISWFEITFSYEIAESKLTE